MVSRFSYNVIIYAFTMLSAFRNSWTFFYFFVRSFMKWFLRKTTRLCELQRICYGEPVGCLRSKGVENSLKLSKSVDIKRVIVFLNTMSEQRKLNGTNHKLALEHAIHTVLIVKLINPSVHNQFIKSFGRCVEHIWGYRQLFHEVEMLRTTQYDPANLQHEYKLLKLWSLLMPNTPLESRITKQWQDIGFQGDDPRTDFRGMGILGLENLLYFASEYPGPSRHVLSHSLHPQYGYAFAIVGINITSMAYHLLRDDCAKTHIYNVAKTLPSLRMFHQFYSYLFYEFDRFWIEAKPHNVMEFAYIKKNFECKIRSLLSNPLTVFRVNFAVDTI